MNEPVAWTCFLDAPAEKEPATVWRLMKNGPALKACRGDGENSNSAIVGARPRGGFVAAGGAGTEEIFSDTSGENRLETQYDLASRPMVPQHLPNAPHRLPTSQAVTRSDRR
jgi:hypothetical protein